MTTAGLKDIVHEIGRLAVNEDPPSSSCRWHLPTAPSASFPNRREKTMSSQKGQAPLRLSLSPAMFADGGLAQIRERAGTLDRPAHGFARRRRL
jgi:hypothetical protein